MPVDQQRETGEPDLQEDARPPEPDRSTFELCFLVIVGLFVLGGLVAALTYSSASIVMPLCIMIPLLILMGVQFGRTLKASRAEVLVSELAEVIRGKNKRFNGVIVFTGWLMLLFISIFILGHYVSIALFMFVMLRVVSKESLVLSIALSAIVTAVLVGLFEFGFHIAMYDGLIYRMLQSSM